MSLVSNFDVILIFSSDIDYKVSRMIKFQLTLKLKIGNSSVKAVLQSNCKKCFLKFSNDKFNKVEFYITVPPTIKLK